MCSFRSYYIHTVAPEVDVSATSITIAVGQSTTLTCSISRSNPSDYTVEWSLTNTNDVTTTLAETGETLVVTDIADNEFRTYTCNVTNSADLSGSANITIEEGGKEFSLGRLLCFFNIDISLRVLCTTHAATYKVFFLL